MPAGACRDPEPKLNTGALPLAGGANVVAVGAAAAGANPKPPPPPEAVVVAAVVVGAAETAVVVLLLLPATLKPKEGTLAGDEEVLPFANGLGSDIVTGATVVGALPAADELPKRPAAGAAVLPEDPPNVKPPEGAEEPPPPDAPTPAPLAAATRPRAPSDALGCAPNVKPLLAGAAEVLVGAGG